MKPTILLLALIAVMIAFSSCSTAYKTGQTPDDVYYSPTRPQDEYLSVNKNDDSKYYGDEYYDDRYLRMKVHNPVLWSDLDDWYYYGDRYNYGYSYFTNYDLYLYNNPWNPYTYWNNYYNPYYHNYVVINPKVSYVYTAPRTVNLNTFTDRRQLDQDYNNPKTFRQNNVSNRFNSENTSRNSGTFLRNIFSGGNSSGNSGSTSSRSSGSSSSGSSKSSSSAPVRKF